MINENATFDYQNGYVGLSHQLDRFIAAIKEALPERIAKTKNNEAWEDVIRFGVADLREKL